MKRINFSPASRKFLANCSKTLSNRIIVKLEMLNLSPCPLDVKKLKGEKNSLRIRIGDYRVIFEVQGDSILITKIGHRKDIYK